MTRRFATVALALVLVAPVARAVDEPLVDLERLTPAEMRAMQAELDRKSAEAREENAVLNRRVDELEQRNAALGKKKADLDTRLADVLARLSALEAPRQP